MHQPVDAREKSTVNNRRWKTHGIKRVDVLERRGSDRRSSVQREIRALRVSDNNHRPIGPRRRIRQVVGSPPLRISREIKAEPGILRPPNRACIRPAEDHVGRPGLVDKGDGTELSKRARRQPSDRIAHAQAPEARARTGGLQEGTIGVGRQRIAIQRRDGRGLGDFSEQASARGTRPGQHVKIHVDQARESGASAGERSARSGVRESRTCSMTVVTRPPPLRRGPDNRGRVGRHQRSILPDGPVLCTISECPQGCRLGL